MKLLAIDTSTDRCSVALSLDGVVTDRAVVTPRGHADLVLPMVDELLSESGVNLNQLDAIAYGRGPGSFTGIRITVSVVQGLAFGAHLPTIGISDLAAVAFAAAESAGLVLAAMDARMGEVYWAIYKCDASKRESGAATALLVGDEHVSPPSDVVADMAIGVVAGSALAAYPELAERFSTAKLRPGDLPHARSLLLLAETEFRAGRYGPAQEAQPVYLRDRVATVKRL
jgi:tRNA threonylcarbamoyladenosine biosynthesis protein TsaB